MYACVIDALLLLLCFCQKAHAAHAEYAAVEVTPSPISVALHGPHGAAQALGWQACPTTTSPDLLATQYDLILASVSSSFGARLASASASVAELQASIRSAKGATVTIHSSFVDLRRSAAPESLTATASATAQSGAEKAAAADGATITPTTGALGAPSMNLTSSQESTESPLNTCSVPGSTLAIAGIVAGAIGLISSLFSVLLWCRWRKVKSRTRAVQPEADEEPQVKPALQPAASTSMSESRLPQRDSWPVMYQESVAQVPTRTEAPRKHSQSATLVNMNPEPLRIATQPRESFASIGGFQSQIMAAGDRGRMMAVKSLPPEPYPANGSFSSGGGGSSDNMDTKTIYISYESSDPDLTDLLKPLDMGPSLGPASPGLDRGRRSGTSTRNKAWPLTGEVINETRRKTRRTSLAREYHDYMAELASSTNAASTNPLKGNPTRPPRPGDEPRTPAYPKEWEI